MIYLLVYLYPINVKTAEPIRPTFLVETTKGKGNNDRLELKNVAYKLFRVLYFWEIYH